MGLGVEGDAGVQAEDDADAGAAGGVVEVFEAFLGGEDAHDDRVGDLLLIAADLEVVADDETIGGDEAGDDDDGMDVDMFDVEDVHRRSSIADFQE